MMMRVTEPAEELGVKKLELLESEDRISALPDLIIHHILSSLPSVKEAIQTCVLSKRWKNQWTGVPVLIFNLMDMSIEYSTRCVDSTLMRHDCPKIKKFHMIKDFDFNKYPQLNEFIRFAIRKHVEELILEFFECELIFPKFIFNHSPLVRLKVSNYTFKPNGKVCWEHLKELDLRCCTLDDDAVDNILRGSPVLESLVLNVCDGFDNLVIVSEYLKKLELGAEISVLEISCPNLEELYLVGDFGARTIKLMNLTSLSRATLNFTLAFGEYDGSSYEKIFQQLQHVKDLMLGAWVIEFLSRLWIRAGQSLPLLNNKRLTLIRPNFYKHRAGIARALRHSPLLEELEIRRLFKEGEEVSVDEENCYGYMNWVFYDCSVSNLMFVDIINLTKKDPDYEHLLHFIEFILKYARVLEKLVVVFENDDKDFQLEVSMDLLSFTRCSPNAAIEFQFWG